MKLFVVTLVVKFVFWLWFPKHILINISVSSTTSVCAHIFRFGTMLCLDDLKLQHAF